MQNFFKSSAAISLALAAFGLAACGGGGGGGSGGGGGGVTPDPEPVANTPPVAAIAAVAPVASGATVTLDASGSTDADGDSLSYAWSVKTGDMILVDANKAKAGFTAPLVTEVASDKVTLSVTVSDGNGGSDTADISVTVLEGVKPELQLLFPAAQSTTDSNDDITFRGTASDNIELATLRVNGEARDVVFGADGGWQIALPVDATANAYTFEAVDAAGNVSEAVEAVITQPRISLGGYVSIDGDRFREFVFFGNDQLFATTHNDEVLRFGTTDFTPTLVADGAGVGSGPDMGNVTGAAFSADGKLRVGSQGYAVYEIATDSLERREFTGLTGIGPALFLPIAMAADPDSGDFYVMSRNIYGTGNYALMRVAENGDRTTLSESSPVTDVTGGGPLFSSLELTSSLVVNKGTAYHVQGDILAVDVGDSDNPGTGARTVFLAGFEDFRAKAIAESADGEFLWALGESDTGVGILQKVPLDGSTPIVVSANFVKDARGKGEPIALSGSSYTLTVDEERGVAYVPLGNKLRIMQIDLVTGDRVLVYN